MYASPDRNCSRRPERLHQSLRCKANWGNHESRADARGARQGALPTWIPQAPRGHFRVKTAPQAPDLTPLQCR